MHSNTLKRLLRLGAAVAMALLFTGCANAHAEDNAAQAPVTPAPAAPPIEADGGRLPETAPEDTRACLIVCHISGEATVLRGTEEAALSLEDVLFQGDEIRTGADSVVILKAEDGKQIWIAADSQLAITAASEDADGEKTTLTLHDGNVVSVIEQPLADNDSYDVETPGLVMAIRGTIASVSYSRQAGESTVAFFEGSGVVSSKTRADSMEISLGERITEVGGNMGRSELTADTLQEAERRFLFDTAYGGPENRERIKDRLESLLTGMEAAENAQGGGKKEEQADSGERDRKTGSSDFETIKRQFLQAKKDYENGKISKQEFLKIKQRYIDAKRAYNR